MQKLWQEFKTFALKGNMIDLAVAVVIGAAFGAVISSLVKNVIMPMLSYIIPTEGGYRAWHIGRIEIGAFLGELVNFAVIALAIFLVIVKLVGMVVKRATPPAGPTTRECPLCLSTIPIKATRCAHCTADLPPVGNSSETTSVA